MSSLRSFVEERAHALGLCALVGLAVHLLKPAPPPRTLEGLAEMLGQAAGAVVDPNDIAWESSPGFLSETFLGSRVCCFWARPKPANLATSTERAFASHSRDNRSACVSSGTSRKHRWVTTRRSSFAAARPLFTTVAFGSIQGVGVIDLDGIRKEDRPEGILDRLLLTLTAYQHSGSFTGLGRTNVLLDVPARQAKLALAPPELHIDLGEQGRDLIYDLRDRSLRGEGGGQPYAARAVPVVHGAKPLVIWGVDTVREEIGNEPITWLENKVFGAKDVVKRTTFNMFSSSAELALQGERQRARPGAGARCLETHGWRCDRGRRPRFLRSGRKPSRARDEWTPVEIAFLKPLPGSSASASKPPPYFFRTFIRPDPKRPYSEVRLIAMDMRQLELGMQAGFEDPKPLTGPPGDGRLPREPEVVERIVATFNGAFKTTHGKYGMMVNRRVLVPAVPGAATIMVTEEREAGLGSWPQTARRCPTSWSAFGKTSTPSSKMASPTPPAATSGAGSSAARACSRSALRSA